MTLTALLAAFAKSSGKKLASELGEPEDQLRAPLEAFVAGFGALSGVPLTMVGEMHLAEERIRPDYAVLVGTHPVPIGFIELKAPGLGADTSRYRGANKVQWQRLSALPNVVYTDGNQWCLYRSGKPARRAMLAGDVRDGQLADPGGTLDALLADFLQWEPETPRSTRQLVTAVAGLCRLLREEVLELAEESMALAGLASDWRDLLFPDATAAEFADGYAQAVTFALLLARAEGIGFEGRSINEIANLLGKQHSLLGKALAVLTDESLITALSTSVSTLVRVCAVVDWEHLAHHGRTPWLRFYEDFLAEYDPELRKRTGSYYTPNEVVDAMVRMVDVLLRSRLGQEGGFLSPAVHVVDPAMGTGTFLLHVIEHVAGQIDEDEGPGAVGPRLKELTRRLVGFERQLGPYAVAELRAFEEFRDRGVDLPMDGLRLYVTDTLDNPYVEETHLAAGYEPIARSRRAANKVKATEPVMVVIGNPPYKDYQRGHGGWVEHGDPGSEGRPILADFIPPPAWDISGTLLRHVYNLYAYFWRWAIWKTFEAHADTPYGVVAFITSAGFTTGPGFAAMRRHMRSLADDIWVIDCTPEGHRPDVPTRIFPGVQQPLAITLVLRDGRTDAATPATVRYRKVTGRRAEKFAQLGAVGFDDVQWHECGSGWTERFTPLGRANWADFPALADLFPWSSPGLGANRTWPIGTTPEVLRARWDELVGAHKPARRAELLKETTDRKLDRLVGPLPGVAGHAQGVIGLESGPCPEPQRIAFRSLHRAWVIPDARLLDRPRPDLWAVRSDRQVFITEQHSEPIVSGPALTFSALLPDLHHYNGRGGRVLPLWRDESGTAANVAPGLLDYLRAGGLSATPLRLVAYAAAVAAHPGYTERFATELLAPGVRIPITADPELWAEAVALGSQVVWLHTFGERFASSRDGRPKRPPRLPADRRPKIRVAIPDTENAMPDSFDYDEGTLTVRLGAGRVGPVTAAVWDYEVSTYRVVQRWIKRRLRIPEGKRTSPLDDIVPTVWTPTMSAELLDLINVVQLLVDLEPAQGDLLERIIDAGRFVTVAALTEAAVLPVEKKARKALRRDTTASFFD